MASRRTSKAGAATTARKSQTILSKPATKAKPAALGGKLLPQVASPAPRKPSPAELFWAEQDKEECWSVPMAHGVSMPWLKPHERGMLLAIERARALGGRLGVGRVGLRALVAPALRGDDEEADAEHDGGGGVDEHGSHAGRWKLGSG